VARSWDEPGNGATWVQGRVFLVVSRSSAALVGPAVVSRYPSPYDDPARPVARTNPVQRWSDAEAAWATSRAVSPMRHRHRRDGAYVSLGPRSSITSCLGQRSKGATTSTRGGSDPCGAPSVRRSRRSFAQSGGLRVANRAPIGARQGSPRVTGTPRLGVFITPASLPSSVGRVLAGAQYHTPSTHDLMHTVRCTRVQR
jgi:hypothetical protein